MKRWHAGLLLGLLLAATVAALRAPAPWVVALAAVALLVAPSRGKAALAIALPAALYGAILAASHPRDAATAAGSGILAGTRLGAALVLNLGALGRVGPERVVEALRLRPLPTAWLAAVLLAAQGVTRDAHALVRARRLEGAWPRGWRRARDVASLMPALAARALERATVRRESLLMAGVAVPALFVPVVAIAALVVADRVALAALPNVKLSYAAVFLGGLLFGARAGAAAAALGMLVSDFLFSALYLPVYANVPAMVLVALLGAAAARWRTRLPALTVPLAFTGAAATFLFSLVADAATLLILPETAGDAAAWRVTLLAGLAFNVPAALANAALFATAVPAVARRLAD